MPTNKIQQNSKTRSQNHVTLLPVQNQQTIGNQKHQNQEQQKQTCIERDFLKENIQFVKLKSLKLRQKIKTSSSGLIESLSPKNLIKPNLVYSFSAKGDAPRSVFERLAACTDATRPNICKKPLCITGTNTSIKLNNQLSAHKKSIKKLDEPPILTDKIDQMVQTIDKFDEHFSENAIIMEPTIFALKKIRDEREKILQEELKEKLLEKRKFGKESAKLEAHLTDLNEFLDTGSISRRKTEIAEKKREMTNFILDRSFLKNLRAQTVPVTSNSKTLLAEKVSTISLKKEIKLNNSSGDGPISKPKKNKTRKQDEKIKKNYSSLI